jgi:hypothetical protein
MLKISPEAHFRRLFEDIRRARAERSANHVLHATSKQQSARSQDLPPCWTIIVISRGSGLRIEGSPPFGEGKQAYILNQFLAAKICSYPAWSNRLLMTWIVPFSRRQKLLAAFLPI